MHRLDPDPVTAPHVRWMFAQRLAGWSAASIARALNERGVLCPSGSDRARNRHRSGQAWTLRTVAAILANPRYTGRQVWNRHGTEHGQRSPGRGGRRWAQAHRSNPRSQWVVSRRAAHPALVSEQDFVAAQAIRAMPEPADGSVRTYVLVGLVRCGICDRRMDSHWVHGRAGYRCRHSHTSAQPRTLGQPKPVYVREDRILAVVLARLGDPPSASGAEPTSREVAEHLRARKIEIRCDARGTTLSSEDSTSATTGDKPAREACRPASTRQRRTPTKHGQEI